MNFMIAKSEGTFALPYCLSKNSRGWRMCYSCRLGFLSAGLNTFQRPWSFFFVHQSSLLSVETASIDGLVSSWSENIFVSSCLRAPRYGLTLWCALGLLVGSQYKCFSYRMQLQFVCKTDGLCDVEWNFALYSPGVAVAVLLGVILGVFIGMLLLVALHCARKR